MATKYLYGAAVQGIQGFIFQTNELKDIVGASELVARICNEFFDKFRNDPNVDRKDDQALVLHAAGNIKYVFDDEGRCSKAVLNFPKEVLTEAPGITVSQAVVKYDDAEEGSYGKAVEKLEAKIKAQRSNQPRPTTIGFMGIERSRRTGLPAVNSDHDDAGTQAKKDMSINANQTLQKSFYGEDRKGKTDNKNINHFTGSNRWIAIIHIDGNGLGQIVEKVGKDRETFRKFSVGLDSATKAAAQAAVEEVLKKTDNSAANNMRPIVLSGDDHTVVCRGDLAIEYTKLFIENFEKETQKKIGDIIEKAYGKNTGLTACAGIAYINAKFPFYYGYNLAEDLCEAAKKDAKQERFKDANNGLAPSCIMFHKVQDSFVKDYSDIQKRELTPQEGQNLTWCAGPYYLNTDVTSKVCKSDETRLTIDELMADVEEVNPEEKNVKDLNGVKSGLRKWLTAMHESDAAAEQLCDRIKEVHPEQKGIIARLTEPKPRKFVDKNKPEEEVKYAFRAYDVLSLASIHSLNTKDKD